MQVFSLPWSKSVSPLALGSILRADVCSLPDLFVAVMEGYSLPFLLFGVKLAMSRRFFFYQVPQGRFC